MGHMHTNACAYAYHDMLPLMALITLGIAPLVSFRRSLAGL